MMVVMVVMLTIPRAVCMVVVVVVVVVVLVRTRWPCRSARGQSGAASSSIIRSRYCFLPLATRVTPGYTT